MEQGAADVQTEPLQNKAMDYASMDRLETRSGLSPDVPEATVPEAGNSSEQEAADAQAWDWLEDTEPGDFAMGESVALSGGVGSEESAGPGSMEVVRAEPEESNFHEGQTFDRYVLQARLGSGAFAEVWRAVETGSLGFSKQVALKILKPGRMDGETREALIHEARVCGMLHHPHLVDVYGVGEGEGTAYIAMEYVDGITLSVLQSRLAAVGMRLPTSVLLDLGIQLCEGLDYAHTATDHEGEPLHLVHRDLKPGNIMLSWTGGVKIADFGLAKATTSDQTTQAGILRGTPGYIAPEVWTGSRDFQPTVDLFAVGVMLWELAVGGSLFKGPLHPLINTVLNRPVEEELARLEQYVPSLVDVVGSCLQRDPLERTQSSWELVERLQALRNALRAPGGLELFLSLVRSVADPSGAQEGSSRIPAVTESTDPEWLSALELATFQTGGFVPADGLATANFERWGKIGASEVGSTRDMTVPERATVVAPGLPPSAVQAQVVDVGLDTQRPEPERSSGYSMGWLVAGAGLLALTVVLGGLVLLRSAGVFGGAGDALEQPVLEEVRAASDALDSAPSLVAEVPVQEASPGDAAGLASSDEEPERVTPTQPVTPVSSGSSSDAAPANDRRQSKPAASKQSRPSPAVARVSDAKTTRSPELQPAVGAGEPAAVRPEPSSAELGPGCVVLRSSPPGALVTLSGRDLGVAGSRVYEVPETSVTIEMNSAGAPVVHQLEVPRGQRLEITCDVSFPEDGRTGCKARMSAAGCP